MTGFTMTIKDTDSLPPKIINRDGTVTVNLSRMARMTGYSLSHLSRVVSRGCKNPSSRCIKKMAAFMGITMDELINLIEEGKVKCLSK